MDICRNKLTTVALLSIVTVLVAAGCYCPAKTSCPAPTSTTTGEAEARAKPYEARRDDVIKWLKGRDGYNDHVRKVVRYAELLNEESQSSADPQVVEVGALLHDCGYQVGKGPEKKVRDLHPELGAAAARGVLPRVGFPPEFTDHVSRIVAAHHSVTKMDTPEWRTVWMADLAVNKDIKVSHERAGKALEKLRNMLQNRREKAQEKADA